MKRTGTPGQAACLHYRARNGGAVAGPLIARGLRSSGIRAAATPFGVSQTGRRRAPPGDKPRTPAGSLHSLACATPFLRSTRAHCGALCRCGWGRAVGAQSCACGGCRWVTHPHRSLLHQFWWGKAPLIGFVENDLPPVGREGRRLTASRAAPYPGGCLLRAKRPQRQAASPALAPQSPPAHRAALPAAARTGASRLNQWQRRHHAGSGGQALPTATSTVPPLLFSRCSCSPIDAATMRFGGG